MENSPYCVTANSALSHSLPGAQHGSNRDLLPKHIPEKLKRFQLVLTGHFEEYSIFWNFPILKKILQVNLGGKLLATGGKNYVVGF